MSLGPNDQARLAQILKQARELELTWPPLERQQLRLLGGDARYQELRRSINACSEAEAESLRRLTNTSTHLHDEISLHHFYACVVPFERLSSRALRDDEFLIAEGE